MTNKNKSFVDRIQLMNEMYNLPVNHSPMLPENLSARLEKFKKTLSDEVSEIDEIMDGRSNGDTDMRINDRDIDSLVAVADLLADVMVYCRSEAMKYGIPLEPILDVIMDSNESKLGADGLPIHDANGKFLKGPNYWKPEPKIKALLMSQNIQKGNWS